MLQVKINENNLNKDIKFFTQVSAYKYFCNFERDDIDVIIDDQIAPIIFKDPDVGFTYDSISKNCEKSQEIEYDLKLKYSFYWIFSTIGIHTVKIIFKKKLIQCNELFCNCDCLYKIDCSNFYCSQMFSFCVSVVEINLGKLDFSLSNDFSYMFFCCDKLENLDTSYLNIQNSKSFQCMFYQCLKLKEIDASKFKTTNCENISNMFYN